MEIISCQCGCGTRLNSIDKWGKSRRYIIGHHPHSREKKYINHYADIPNTRKNRFYAKVMIPNKKGCMEWIGGMNTKKRAHFVLQSLPRKSENAARYSYRLHYGVDPGDLYVCHRCDNPRCVAPNHLFLGTQKDNMQDMINKNRDNFGGRQ